MTVPTPEEIAAAQAALKRKPDDAVLVEAPYDVADGSGHRIAKGTVAWRSLGTARYDGPPIAGESSTIRTYHWTCRACGDRKGWS